MNHIGVLKVEDTSHPATRMLGDSWPLVEEFYQFGTAVWDASRPTEQIGQVGRLHIPMAFSRDRVHVLLSLDTSKMDIRDLGPRWSKAAIIRKPGAGRSDADDPSTPRSATATTSGPPTRCSARTFSAASAGRLKSNNNKSQVSSLKSQSQVSSLKAILATSTTRAPRSHGRLRAILHARLGRQPRQPRPLCVERNARRRRPRVEPLVAKSAERAAHVQIRGHQNAGADAASRSRRAVSTASSRVTRDVDSSTIRSAGTTELEERRGHCFGIRIHVVPRRRTARADNERAARHLNTPPPRGRATSRPASARR